MKAKALFLLVVFLFNTIVGFGCSIFMDKVIHQHLGGAHHKINFEGSIKNSLAKVIEKEASCCKTISNNLLVQVKLLPDDTKINSVAPALIPIHLSHCTFSERITIPVKAHQIEQHRYYLPHPDIRVSIQSFQL